MATNKRGLEGFVQAGAGGASSADEPESKTKVARREVETLVKEAETAEGAQMGNIFQKLVLVLSALSLSTAQGLREVTGAVFLTFLMDSDSLPVKAM